MKVRLLIMFLFVTSPLWSQPGDPSSDPDVPLSGIEFLIGGGLALGIRQLLKRKKR